MKTKSEKIYNIYMELKQEAKNAPEVEEDSPYNNYRRLYIPDLCDRLSMELEIAMRTKFGRTGRLSALCRSWENRAINLFQKVDEYDDLQCPRALLLQEMGKIYWEKSEALRLSNQPKTVFEFMFNIFRKYAKRPGASRF